ncbi:hypothetical protein VTK73DRAFT_4471 [Phialemonium thermophilum]|uniref:Uncharacterized protein n=1 Tax=Phialemonium thermophilum TaxID=223376 RepID=A0ABR3V8H2_9PEZI
MRAVPQMLDGSTRGRATVGGIAVHKRQAKTGDGKRGVLVRQGLLLAYRRRRMRLAPGEAHPRRPSWAWSSGVRGRSCARTRESRAVPCSAGGCDGKILTHGPVARASLPTVRQALSCINTGAAKRSGEKERDQKRRSGCRSDACYPKVRLAGGNKESKVYGWRCCLEVGSPCSFSSCHQHGRYPPPSSHPTQLSSARLLSPDAEMYGAVHSRLLWL